MEMPTVSHEVRDVKRNITYDLRTYRQLSDEEARAHVALCVRMNAKMIKKIKKNSRLVINTLIGARDPSQR